MAVVQDIQGDGQEKRILSEWVTVIYIYVRSF